MNNYPKGLILILKSSVKSANDYKIPYFIIKNDKHGISFGLSMATGHTMYFSENELANDYIVLTSVFIEE